MLMQLMFLATRTRPDILTAVCALATKCKEPREADEVRLYRVIGYLAEYKDLELHCKVTDFKLHAYFDAGWACHTDMKGHSGMALTLGHFGFPILYNRSRKTPPNKKPCRPARNPTDFFFCIVADFDQSN